MATLSKLDKMKLEKLLDMGGGYVLEFSNRTFEEFVLDSVGIDIYDDKFDYWSGSKANRLRRFWDLESASVVAKVLEDLYELWLYQNYAVGETIKHEDADIVNNYLGVVGKLKGQYGGEEVEVFENFSTQREFEELSKSIRNYITEDKPELALDRLHTFVTKYLRGLGEKYEYPCGIEVPLHSLLGSYIKAKKKIGGELSVTTERILKSSISILDSFNDIRNNSSYAHDNRILNQDESRLIVSNISSLVRFIDSIEVEEQPEEKKVEWDDDIPF